MSGVKVTNERPSRPIPEAESVDGVDDGIDGTDWEPGITTGIPPGADPGDVLTWDGDSWEPEPGAGSGMVPFYIPVGDSFTVPIYKQALFADPIEVDGGLIVNGVLIGVD